MTTTEVPGSISTENARKTADEMDEIRHRTMAYEYLCRLEETKAWLEACLKEPLPPTTELERALRNGVYLAKLGHFISPETLPLDKIYDVDQKRYQITGLQFRYTDNINQWLEVLKVAELPRTFHPETTDVYDKKNMPRVVYCLHALSAHLFKLGRAPLIQDLYGKAQFTEEQIDVMSKELKRYGIKMPPFQKIGGLLSTDLGDNAILHAAIININNNLDSMDAIEPALTNSAAKICYVLPDLIPEYFTVLAQAKSSKIQQFVNRSMNESYVADVYDELLSQNEIQGYILSVNTLHTITKIFHAVSDENSKELYHQLSQPWLNMKHLDFSNREFYLDFLNKFQNDCEGSVMNHLDCAKIFQEIIIKGNDAAEKQRSAELTIVSINKALDNNDQKVLYECLKTLIDIEEFFIPLFCEELQLIKLDLERDLSYDDILDNAGMLSTVARISKILDRNDYKMLWEHLSSNILEIDHLQMEIVDNYFRALKAARRAKQQAGLPCTLLTLMDIQDCIDEVNKQEDKACDLISQLQCINRAVKNNDKEELVETLRSKFEYVKEEESILYMIVFKTYLKEKENNELWLEDVQKIISKVNKEIEEVKRMTKLLVAINFSVTKSNYENFELCIQQLDNTEVTEDLFRLFSEALINKQLNYKCPWVVFHTKSGRTAYINIENCVHSWTTPKNFIPSSQYLSLKDIKFLLAEFAKSHDLQKQKKIVESIILLQAHIRGYLIREKYCTSKYYRDRRSQAVTIQAWWRMIVIRRNYKANMLDRVIARKQEKSKPKDVWSCYKEREIDIVRIQALWRGKKARQAFVSLIHMKNPPFNVVKYFVPILNFSIDDYEREIKLQTLRAEAVQIIRKNQELSKQLDDMDIKIGLLIQNRITLQDVLAHRKKMNDIMKDHNSTMQVNTMKSNEKLSMNPTTAVRGLKSLTKENRIIWENYQQLFYTLQTNPKYLSKLLFCLPHSRVNQFLQNVILTLYNFGSNARDEYLLLKLFRYSLEEEINCKFSKPMEIITGNPIVLKMVVNHARRMNGLLNLRKIVGPLVEKMLNDKNISIETSPVDIYKAWRNQTESRTGQISSLPYVVTQEQALSYEEVRIKLKSGLETLKRMVTLFLERIVESYDILPFSIIYIARVLHHMLTKKFPHAPEKEILKVVGHLIYYQFINAAIVAPDAFNIVTISRDQALTNDQRRNLASVAKILHFAASKKGFGEESAHLQCLNPFIIECHEQMKEFFRKCCQGPTLEEYFSMDEYSEATLPYKPQIYISVQEICDTHSLLVEYEDVIAPDASDKLHEILDNLGPTNAFLPLVPSGSTEVFLTLEDKDQVIPEDATDINKLFIKTKELCISVLPFLNGDHLLEGVCIGTTKEQQEQYKAQVEQKLYSGIIKDHENMTLREHISMLRKYLDKLEEEGYVTREDGYQSIITAIGLDLCNKGKYRRNQLRALHMMRNTKKALEEKLKYYQDQCDYYNQYINKCLENLDAGKRSVHSFHNRKGKALKSKMSVKYSAQKLHDKGVLIEIEGLVPAQFKNVMFEIAPTDHSGTFSIKGKFMGVEVDKVEIDIQNLLQLQYDGCAIMDLFNKAKVNVNLLLFLLNKKFYGK